MAKPRWIRILRTVLHDVLLTGVVLCVFALFHHVLPRDVGYQGETLSSPTPTASGTVDPSPGLSPDPSGDPTAEPTASPLPTPTRATTPLPTAAAFVDLHYDSPNLTISITSFHRDGATGYIADLRTTDPLNLLTGFAGGTYALGKSAWPLDMAKQEGALLAVNGDYFGVRNVGIVVRNGVLYRASLYRDVLVMYRDGTMRTFSKTSFDLEAMKAAGAWQAWSFGPMLLADGQVMTSFDSDVTAANPRTAIGYYEPGHYCFVVVDGRQPGYSNGLTMKQMSQLFYDLGCTVAYNLDGGQSSEMVFDGALVNRPYRGGRHVSDIVYVKAVP